MRCEACGAEARGRVLVEMWHGDVTGPGFGGFIVRAGPWSCGSHPVEPPSAEDARYFAQRFIVVNGRPPAEGIRVGRAFVELTETAGRELDQDPEALLRKQVEGPRVTIETAGPKDWAELQRQARERDKLTRPDPLSVLRGRPSPR